MNEKTGAIATFENRKDAIKAGFTFELTDKQAADLKPMSRRERLHWLKKAKGTPVDLGHYFKKRSKR